MVGDDSPFLCPSCPATSQPGTPRRRSSVPTVWRRILALKYSGSLASRFATEGVNNLRGDPLVADLSVWQILLQVSGFSPAEVAKQYERNSALKNYEQHILDADRT